MGVRVPDSSNSRREREGWAGWGVLWNVRVTGWVTYALGVPRSPALPPGLQQGLQGRPDEREGSVGFLSPHPCPLPQGLPHTHLLSLCSRGPDHSLRGTPGESPRFLPPPHPYPAVQMGGAD